MHRGLDAMACLELTSLSSLSLERASDSYDLVFDLSSKPLPAFSAIDCWRGRSISPLRDRVMIEWLFSHYEAEVLLDSMSSTINEALKKKQSSTVFSANRSTSPIKEQAVRTTLLVAVACQNGAQHSVCLVERLYEKYSFESVLEPEGGGVKVAVKRKHCEATKGEWLNTKEPVWQHSKFPVKRLLKSPKDLVMPSVWSNLPLESAQQVEIRFRQDPLSTDLDIGDHIIDFERGVLMNKKSQEEFRIRSTIAHFDDKVRSSWLDDVEYRALHKSYNSAGILFYSVHPRTGEPVFLLGHMTYGSMCWCDFGGLKSLWERAKYTAARECYEETLGIFGSNKSLVSMLENYVENNVFKIVNKDSRYVGHYLRVPYKDYPAIFKKALATFTGKIEVDKMRWFSLSCLKCVIHKALLDQYEFKVKPLNKDGYIDAYSKPAPLRIEFVHSLCIADQLGVLESIEHITKILHERNQPPPPPYVSLPRPRTQYSKDGQSERKDLTTVEDKTQSPEAISSTNRFSTPTDAEFKVNSLSEGIEDISDKLLTCSKLSREGCWKDLTSEESHSNFCLDDDGHSHSEHRLQRPQNESNSNGSISESTCSGTAGISSSEVPVEIQGLRRRRREDKTAKKLESPSSSNAQSTRTKNFQVKKSEFEDVATSSPSIVYYGIGAGTFLY